MKKFRFQLETALLWRRQREQAEQAKLEDMADRRAKLVARRDEIESLCLAARLDTASRSFVEGTELAALDAYRRASGLEQARLDEKLHALDREIDGQRKVLMEASRQARLLEKLKDSKRAAWRRDADRVLEDEASELYLSQWLRSQQIETDS